MPDPEEGRRFYLKTTIQDLQPTLPGRVYWLRLKQKKDALFPSHCFEQHSAALTATGASVAFGIPFVLKLKKDARQKWKVNRLAISVHEGSSVDDPHCVMTSFHLDLPDLYDACVDGLYTFRQFVRGNFYLTFVCQRVDPTLPLHPVPAPPTQSPQLLTDPQLVQELVLMFPTLPAAYIRHAMETFATKEALIDDLLQHQRTDGAVVVLPSTPTPAPAQPPSPERDATPPPVVAEPSSPPSSMPWALESEESDFQLAQRLQELETVRFDNEQREFERRLLSGQHPQAPPHHDAPLPPTHRPVAEATAVETQAPPPPQSRDQAAHHDGLADVAVDDVRAELCAAVRASVAEATEAECISALDNTDWTVDLAVRLLLMQHMDGTTIPHRVQGGSPG